MGQMNEKSGELKDESQSELFSAPGDAQEFGNVKTTNAFEVQLMVQFRVNLIIQLELPKGSLQDLYKYALKGALQVAIELHLTIQCIR